MAAPAPSGSLRPAASSQRSLRGGGALAAAAATAGIDDWEVTPLSGDHPFFTTVMSKSHVQKQFQLVRRPHMHHLFRNAAHSTERQETKSAVASSTEQNFLVLRSSRLVCTATSRRRSSAAAGRGRRATAATSSARRSTRRGGTSPSTTPCGSGTPASSSSPRPLPELEMSGLRAGRRWCYRVQVLRGGLPEEITSKGATPDEPLVIVD
ncbi:hypothetical protein C2845_PM09G00520 [Panicum miliaceum]|uniref:Uncharacterized protein n=1 Tax=Panicum miliaceum TaxID=4540 RepID=A0A3L6S1U2_PANMI|nr:hypothetical protein C2845_PM09G00520 [Panicum miliaceum]